MVSRVSMDCSLLAFAHTDHLPAGSEYIPQHTTNEASVLNLRSVLNHLQLATDLLDHWFPCHGKCFVQTDSELIDLCPSGTRKDDVIAVLYGGRVPYVLRAKNDEEYYLIGECFVQGLMNGEAFRTDGQLRVVEIFTLF